MQVTLYSFREVVSLLNQTGALLGPDMLARWVREVQGDRELAYKMEDAIKQGNSDHERLELIKGLMQQRLKQCEEIIGL